MNEDRPFRIRGPLDSSGKETWWHKEAGWISIQANATLYTGMKDWKSSSPPTALHTQAMLVFEESGLIPQSELAEVVHMQPKPGVTFAETQVGTPGSLAHLLRGNHYTLEQESVPPLDTLDLLRQQLHQATVALSSAQILLEKLASEP